MPYGPVFKIIFGAVSTLTAFSLLVAAMQAKLSAMMAYDRNAEAMRSLTPEQAAEIVRTVKQMTALTAWPLFASTLCWMALCIFCYSRTARLNKGDQI